MPLIDTNNEVEMEINGVLTGMNRDLPAPKTLSGYEFFKGFLDRVLAVIAVVTLTPVLAIIALCIRIDSPGGAIYRREQVGKNGRHFIAYKFRSMRVNNDDSKYKDYLVKYIKENRPYLVDENGRAVFKVVNDPRVTRVGAFLRRSNLDELPQLFNILKGDMAFIGPRPDIPFSVNMYMDWQRKRLNVTPGLSGLWQVSGRKSLSFEDMVRMDIEYIERRSLLLDIKLMLQTVGTILKGDGS